ncbi:hypothetical protein [Sandarakinorhabdus sp.]|uniref:hypothetical protein n=1 Tax=Sandarakinorhabdus sp. TaxID=1916663 RepID=UPI003341D322
MNSQLPGLVLTLAAAALAALVPGLFAGLIIIAGFRDENWGTALTIALFATAFGLPYALLAAVVGPRLATRASTAAGRIAVWLGTGFVCGCCIVAIPSVLLGTARGLDIMGFYGGLGMLGSTVLMAMLSRR